MNKLASFTGGFLALLLATAVAHADDPKFAYAKYEEKKEVDWKAAASAAPKEDKAFTVGNYPIEAHDTDAVTAKERAIAEGQQAAFRSLLRRIVPVTAYNRLHRVRAVKAAGLIDGFSVRSERNSSTDYIASYDFAFQAEAVRRLLDRENIPFLDRQAPPVTLVPIYRAPGGEGVPEIYTDARGSDSWLYAWKGLDLANALAPVNLAALKREVHADSIKAALDGDQAAVRTIAREYQADDIMVAILEPDLGQKKVHVTLVGRDAVAPFTLKRTYRLDGPDLAYTAELAAVVALGVLDGRWKAINVRSSDRSVSAGNGAAFGDGGEIPRPAPIARPGFGAETAAADPLKIAVEFRNMGEWQRISRQLSETPEISELDVEGLSSRGARVSLRYPGGGQNLALALAQQGLILTAGAGGNWVLVQR